MIGVDVVFAQVGMLTEVHSGEFVLVEEEEIAKGLPRFELKLCSFAGEVFSKGFERFFALKGVSGRVFTSLQVLRENVGAMGHGSLEQLCIAFMDGREFHHC